MKDALAEEEQEGDDEEEDEGGDALDAMISRWMGWPARCDRLSHLCCRTLVCRQRWAGQDHRRGGSRGAAGRAARVAQQLCARS